MNVTNTLNDWIMMGDVHPQASGISTWTSVWDALPAVDQTVPIWDGDYVYYATYTEKDGKQFWMVSNINTPHRWSGMMKNSGDQVYPIHWMKISPPAKGT